MWFEIFYQTYITLGIVLLSSILFIKNYIFNKFLEFLSLLIILIFISGFYSYKKPRKQ